MSDDKTISIQFANKNTEEETQREGSKGGESYFTTWYEFESDRKDKDKEERA